MAEYVKPLGGVTTETNVTKVLYATGASSRAIAPTLIICNWDTTDRLYSIWHVDGAPSTQTQRNVLAYYQPIGVSKTIAFQVGITMAPTNNVIVQASCTSVTFTLEGSEII